MTNRQLRELEVKAQERKALRRGRIRVDMALRSAIGSFVIGGLIGIAVLFLTDNGWAALEFGIAVYIFALLLSGLLVLLIEAVWGLDK